MKPAHCLIAILAGSPAFAAPERACDSAAETAAREFDVPLSVMMALTRVETGRGGEDGLQPWPWAVHHAGRGTWYPSKPAATEAVQAALEAGKTNLDIGCFQLNIRWHSKGFTSLDEMFDPLSNARYAARFIAEKYAKSGDWVQAAGAYHSLEPVEARSYAGKFAAILQGLGDPRIATEEEAERPNLFPLLTAGEGSRTAGSLVFLGAGSGAMF